MTKRLFTLAALLMLALTGIQAQSIVGKWKADNSFKQELMTDAPQDFNMFMEMGKSTITVSFEATVKEDDSAISLRISLPGTYTKSGSTVNCRLDEQKFDVEILDVETTDPEMRELLENAELKKMILQMAVDGIKKDSSVVDAFKPVAIAFKTFTVSALTKDSMTTTLKADDGDTLDITFNRVK